ncbi:uncharacterized protein SPSK_00347 [Sporothrix schenckii 1099-18]|uniref:Uncharacterized protein n=1 Tax=Sporothrix schenckii 1099-18 TaxID=1397361 RepID=A0A0F2M771_SPOSC|nr:uncharacterized protein SPSK_00347 [Sporothrix schenckii 1099-18]KJR84021.1 hypothetical protein SPSK_00347 [Sporothrix schenckii 1099-18]
MRTERRTRDEIHESYASRVLPGTRDAEWKASEAAQNNTNYTKKTTQITQNLFVSRHTYDGKQDETGRVTGPRRQEEDLPAIGLVERRRDTNKTHKAQTKHKYKRRDASRSNVHDDGRWTVYLVQ